MKWRLIVLFISLIFSVGLVSVVVCTQVWDSNDISNTTEYIATFSSVQIIDNVDNPYAMLQTEEYKNDFYISPEMICDIEDDLRDLKSGEVIYVRVPNIEADQTNQENFVSIVSLRTQEKEILSLDDYNEHIAMGANIVRAGGLITAGGLFVLSVYCAVSLFFKRKKVNRTPSKEHLPWNYSPPEY